MRERPDDDADGGRKIAAFRDFAADRLAEIATLLTADAKITLVARFPGYPERDLVVTNDDLAETIAALQRRVARR